MPDSDQHTIKEAHLFGDRAQGDRLTLRALDAIAALTARVRNIDWVDLGVRSLLATAVVGGGALVGYEVTDVVGQPEQPTLARILNTQFIPAHTQIYYVPKSKGGVSPRIRFVPDQFNALIEVPEVAEPRVVSIDRRVYADLTQSYFNGTLYQAHFVTGRWSHTAKYPDLNRPVEQAPAEQQPASARRPGRRSW